VIIISRSCSTSGFATFAGTPPPYQHSLEKGRRGPIYGKRMPYMTDDTTNTRKILRQGGAFDISWSSSTTVIPNDYWIGEPFQ